MPDDRISDSLYERDLNAWALAQAAALRAAGGALARAEDQATDLLRALDWDNLAEEIEGLARKDRRELSSRLSRIVEHLVKLEFSPTAAPRDGWIETVLRERAEIEAILEDSPSLRNSLPGLLAGRTEGAFRIAAKSLEAHGEAAAAAKARAGRLGAPYRLDEVLGPWLPAVPA